MIQYIKFVGVPKSCVSKLHDIERRLEYSGMPYWLNETGRGHPVKLPLFKITSSKLDKDHETYTIEIKVDMTHSCFGTDEHDRKPGNWFAPRVVMDEIYKALDVFPEEGKFVLDKP